MNLKNKKVLVTGASFIGLHLLSRLIKEKVRSIRVVNLTDKNKKNIKAISKSIEFINFDLRNTKNANKAVKNIDLVFHLAAAHGGRGYVELNNGYTASNLLLDGGLFSACVKNNIEKIFYPSSGCVYPNFLQKDPNKELFLKENMVGPPYEADNMYGWAKLMAEMTLKAYYKKYGLQSAIGRFFTVYGMFSSESHAVTGTIAKAFIKQDPFEVWGDGNQIRNWTYIDDIVDGIILLTKKIKNALSVNLGTQEKIRVIEMVRLVWKLINFYPKKTIFTNMPVGPLNRVCDNSLALKLLNWKPKYSFEKGLKKTVDWYISNKNRDFVKNNLSRLLLNEEKV